MPVQLHVAASLLSLLLIGCGAPPPAADGVDDSSSNSDLCGHKAKGEACLGFVIAGPNCQCAGGLVCVQLNSNDTYRCQDPLGNGQGCVFNSDCKSKNCLYASYDDGGEDSGWRGYECSDGKDGALCRDDGDCVMGYSCEADVSAAKKVCTPQEDPGGGCSRNRQCKSGSCKGVNCDQDGCTALVCA
jgi:hypothetical protein